MLYRHRNMRERVLHALQAGAFRLLLCFPVFRLKSHVFHRRENNDGPGCGIFGKHDADISSRKIRQVRCNLTHIAQDCRASRISWSSLLVHPSFSPIEKPPEILSTWNFCRGRNLSYPITRARVCPEAKWSGLPLETLLVLPRVVGKPLRPYGKQRNDDSNKGVMTVMDGIDNRSSLLLPSNESNSRNLPLCLPRPIGTPRKQVIVLNNAN